MAEAPDPLALLPELLAEVEVEFVPLEEVDSPPDDPDPGDSPVEPVDDSPLEPLDDSPLEPLDDSPVEDPAFAAEPLRLSVL